MGDLYTLEEARAYVKEGRKDGVTCPCCDQYAKEYKRPLTSAMAYGLILTYRYFKDNPFEEWLHVEDHFKSLPIPSSIRGDYSKLRFWGFVEAKMGEREDGSKRVGLYRITESGKAFAQNKTFAPHAARIYNNTFLWFYQGDINILGALKQKFSYSEIMGPPKYSPQKEEPKRFEQESLWKNPGGTDE